MVLAGGESCHRVPGKVLGSAQKLTLILHQPVGGKRVGGTAVTFLGHNEGGADKAILEEVLTWEDGKKKADGETTD